MEYNKEIKNRLKRIEGQIKGVLGMMELGKDCKSVVAQLSAARNAIDRAIALIVSSNLEHCLRESLGKGEKAVELLVKSR
ncbi:metal-sensitive transcriptional regulator [Bacillus smithii]|uniref:metal-sensitive transcriptional regulator n=1 Tax=Bacillus smithii TaxID=1479 RepID=UPI0030C94783